jgi:DNA-binding MarR family transcriptional regulator
MKTKTAEKILEFINQQGQVSPKKIIEYIGFGAPAIYRQLKKLINLNLIQKSGIPPHIVYHPPMTEKEKIIYNAKNWVTETYNAIPKDEASYCQTRDVFQHRNERLTKDLCVQNMQESSAYLLAAVVGEIGNNSFDHNLGNWPDLPGIYFDVNLKEKIIILADRGQGILTTLQKTLPAISDDLEALKIAFTRIVSGRAPEVRGNGLKFVKKIVEQNNLTLNFYSGLAVCKISGSTPIEIKQANQKISGTVAIIEF